MMAIVHIDDAVAATVAALTAEAGVYNIVDDNPQPVVEWLPAFARWVNAPEARYAPPWVQAFLHSGEAHQSKRPAARRCSKALTLV
jgi:nucleoside-diphosphate-sugar epimerase